MNKKILICGGTGCLSSKSREIKENLEKELKNRNIDDVEVVLTGCFGFCEKGPIVKVVPANNFYIEVKPEDAKDIIEIDIIDSKKVERILYKDPVSQKAVTDYKKMNFYQKQERRVLKNCGAIDPENIDDFLKNDGYKASKKAISEMTRDFVIKNIIDSGLRGRGGGGFPTGIKWEIASKNHAEQKYIVCNADEGDPGAFMDRSILEGDPHSVIEGMMIAGYAIGATKGLVYIRAEYPLAIERLEKAIESARERGYLGKNLFGTDFEFDIEIKFGAGAFVCGEETALIHSMEGKRGEPTSKPPYPAEKGFWDMPTVVNNVETLVNVPRIILNGVEWFREVGTEKSPGTKVFALSGKINNVGLVEVPMGISLREIIFEIGEGIKDNKKFKAVQTGGPSGGCLNEEDLDTPIDFDSLASKGAIMGSGGMVVMDEDDCMVSVAKFFLEFTLDESCGKCTPCRIGNTRLYEILDRITKGKGKLEDLALLKELSECIKATSLCGLGQTSANPVLSTLNKFYNEYIDHVVEKRCTAKACQKLVTYVITDACRGCTACTRVCAVKAIEGNIKEKHFIDPEKCVRCGACISACRFNAIIKL
ncbi:MAG: NADH-quinone oxidoreductase subunit NuoF [Fusobacterium sp.]|uniref:NADH-quinone oxidoreductase subunit NuoF n=1 Tax=Fusobacterium mortiferum TaxID=850 RepID=UPI00195ABD91|nr:NADH-quinone oxidoreductase subunit NuoF [Fusobacterium sp.]MBM6691076.1 4Fe-4S binding protein [Fusobacterium mortiferum]MDO5788370.1 NADH-quinone oxidoreductase subunit NuoF [Fusobacterium sp.]